MQRGFGSKQPSALRLPIEHPLQPCDPEQARPQRQDAEPHYVTVAGLHHYLLLHHLPGMTTTLAPVLPIQRLLKGSMAAYFSY